MALHAWSMKWCTCDLGAHIEMPALGLLSAINTCSSHVAECRDLHLPAYIHRYQPVSMQPLRSYTPAVVQASAQGINLQAADVFFSLCMLQLPQQSMATFFVRSVQGCAELMASLDRMAPLLVPQDRTQMIGEGNNLRESAGGSHATPGNAQKSMSSGDTQEEEV